MLLLWEIFETIVLPRKIDRKLRLTRYYYLTGWLLYGKLSDFISDSKRRTAFLSIFGPFSLIGLFLVWAAALVFDFALMNWALRSNFKLPDGEAPSFLLHLYASGTTLATLGLGDVIPRSPFARFSSVVEAGLGLGLAALVISYLPTLYQAFSRRELEISLLDARAGSPPCGSELLHRSTHNRRPDNLEKLLSDWERWCSEIMEGHISYPVLCYFRSQHTNQSWITALTAILDACALCVACLEHDASSQALLTFAIARHAVVDITQVFHQKPSTNMPERLAWEVFVTIRAHLSDDGFLLQGEGEAWAKLTEMRRMYEPYVFTLAGHLRMELAPWTHAPGSKDNWMATKWKGMKDA